MRLASHLMDIAQNTAALTQHHIAVLGHQGGKGRFIAGVEKAIQ